MARRIILHIGAPKAGSTFLQRVLLKNSERLAAKGVAYPHAGGTHPGNGIDIKGIDAVGFDAMFQDGAETVVLSHEDLFALEQEARGLARLAREAGVPIAKLVFLRPWSEFCAGDFSQHMKQNFSRYLTERRAYDGRSFEEMAARRASRLAPAAFFLRWSRLIPLPSITIASHRAIVETIEEMLGEPALDWNIPRHLSNPSLRLSDCETLAAMIGDPSIPPEDVRAAFHAAHHAVGHPDPARTPERMAGIEAMFAEQNEALFHIYQFDNRADKTVGWPGPAR